MFKLPSMRREFVIALTGAIVLIAMVFIGLIVGSGDSTDDSGLTAANSGDSVIQEYRKLW